MTCTVTEFWVFVRASFHAARRAAAALRRDYLLRAVGPEVMVEWWQLFE